MLQVILFTTLSGVIGTGLGGLIGLFFSNAKTNIISSILCFAGGIMLSIVFADLIPESMEYAGFFWGIMGLIIGIFTLFAINYFFGENKLSKSKMQAIKTLISLSDSSSKSQFKSLKRAGIFMFFAIALHNLPEGMAIGATNNITTSLSLTLAIIIAIHDIPEGMAISLPLASGGVKKYKAFLYSCLAGATTVIGGIIGALIGQISPVATGISLSFAGGAMLYVVFFEIIPESLAIEKTEYPMIFSLIGIILGYIIIYAI